MNSTQNSVPSNKPNNQPKKNDIGDCWINPTQIGNPVWKSLRIQKKVKENQVSDFILPESNLCLVFLSLKFHQTYPLYLQDKLEKLELSEEYKTYTNRILLLLFDDEDPSDQLMEITILTMERGFKLLVGFSYSDIASYLGSFKYIEKNKSQLFKEIIKEKDKKKD